MLGLPWSRKIPGESLPADSRCILVDDFTRKGLLAHLEKSGSGLLAYEEMGAFFEVVFKRQAEGNAERAHFCRLYDGGLLKASYADNQGRLRTTTVEEPHVCIGGFQTPDTFLEQYCQLLSSQDGFADRLLLCSPRPRLLKQMEVDDFARRLSAYKPALQDFKCLYNYAAKCSKLSPQMTFDPIAKEAYNEYCDDVVERLNAQWDQGSCDGNFSKDTRSLTRLCGILHILEWIFDNVCDFEILNDLDAMAPENFVMPHEISIQTVNRAVHLMDYFDNQRQVYQKIAVHSLRTPDTVCFQESIEKKIQHKVLYCDGNYTTPREIVRVFNKSERPVTAKVIEVMTSLEEKGFGKLMRKGMSRVFVKATIERISQDTELDRTVYLECYHKAVSKTIPPSVHLLIRSLDS